MNLFTLLSAILFSVSAQAFNAEETAALNAARPLIQTEMSLLHAAPNGEPQILLIGGDGEGPEARSIYIVTQRIAGGDSLVQFAVAVRVETSLADGEDDGGGVVVQNADVLDLLSDRARKN